MYRFLGLCLLALAVGLAAASPASAQGFGVYEQGACMMGRGGAGVADPCQDGSGVFFNPASLSFGATTITVGGALINPSGRFVDTSGGPLNGTISTLNNRWYPVPNVYASIPYRKRFAFGVGVFAPYGLTSEWPSTSEGRFLGYKSLVQGVYIQPTLAIKINERASVGVGVDLTYLNVELRQHLDLSTQFVQPGVTFGAVGVPANTDFADLQLKGNAWHGGYHIGLQVKATDRVSFGLRYLSGQTVGVTNGTIHTTQIPTGLFLPAGLGGAPIDAAIAPLFASGQKLSNQSATTSIPLPAQFVAGVAVKASPSIKIFLDYQFTNWAAFSVLPINGQYLTNTIVESYRDTNGFRLGGEFNVGRKNVIRAGYSVHPPAAPDQTVTPNLPEAYRHETSVGFGSQLSKSLRFDVAYMYLGQVNRAGRTTPTVNNGTFNFSANLLSASLSLVF
jgi:long-chain fatty acid transport protein